MNLQNQLNTELQDQITDAIENPYSQSAVLQQQKEQKELIDQFLSEQISKNDLWEKLGLLEQKLPYITLTSLEEMRLGLKIIGVRQEDTIKITKDLLFDFHRAKIRNLPIRYILQIYTMNGLTAFYIGIQIFLGDVSISDEKAREYLKNKC